MSTVQTRIADPIIEFGKYIGQPRSALVADRAYSAWLIQSSWVRTDQPDLYRVLINAYPFAPRRPLRRVGALRKDFYSI